MFIVNTTINMSNNLLTRQVKTANEVIARHPTIAPIAAFGEKLGDKGERYLTEQRGLAALKVTKAAALERNAQARAELVMVTSAWIGPLSADVDGFVGASFLRTTNVTLDVLEDAEGVLEVVRSQVPALPYADTLLSQLSAAMTSAREADTAAQLSTVAVQHAQGSLRSLGRELNRLLIGLRRAVRATLGRSHVDYQRLRVARAGTAEEPPDTTTPEVPIAPEAPEADTHA